MIAEPEALSEREMQVLRLVASGLTNDQIAQNLVISTNTVKVHLRNIFAKLGVASRTEASLYAIRQGWITLQPPPTAADNEPAVEAPPPTAADNEPAAEVSPRRPRSILWWTLRAALAGLAILAFAVLLNLSGVFDRVLPPSTQSVPSPNTPLATQRWSSRAAMSTPRSDLALVTFQGSLYAIGGYGPDGVTTAAERFDPADDAWISLAAKPTAAAEVQAAVLGGHIYVPGGRGAQGQPTAVTEVYMVERNQWVTAATLPRPLSAYALLSFEGKLYLFGGWDGAHYRQEILRYDPETDRWEEAGRLPFPLAHAGAVVADDHILIIGGINTEGPLNVLLVYSPAFATISPEPLIGVSLGSVRAAIMFDVYLYVMADPEAPSAPVLWQRQIRSAAWQTIERPPDGFYPGGAIAGVGTELFVIGGRSGETPLPQTLEYRAIFVVTPLPMTAP